MIVSRRELLLALAVFTALALAFSWPLALHLRHEIPVGTPAADAPNMLYGVTSGAQALSDHPFHYFSAAFFYPYQSSLSFLDETFGVAVMAAPVDWLTGSMFVGFNVAWMLTFVLSGLGAFLLARYLTENTAAAGLAGVIYAFQPFRYHNAGLINVLAVMWIPFALLSLHLWVETRLRRHLFLFLAFAVLQFLCTAYSGAFLILAVLVYLGVLLAVERGSTLELLSRQRWVILIVFGLGMAILAPFVSPYLDNLSLGLAEGRSLGAAALFSARLADFVTPAPGSLLHGLAPWSDAARQPLFPGVVGLGLALYFMLRRGWRHHRHRPEMLFYTVFFLLAASLCLGPAFTAGGRRFPLPFAVVHFVVPGAAFMRAPVRFALPATLALALLAGAGLVRLASLRPRKRPARRAITYGLVAVAALEIFAAPIRLLDPLPHGVPTVYRWLGSVAGPMAILELPMAASERDESTEIARYLLFSLFHKKRLANGMGGFVPPITRKLRARMQEFPDRNSLAMLRELGIGYVLVHADRYPPQEAERIRREVEANPGLTFKIPEDPIWVVEVVPGGLGAGSGGATTYGTP